MSQGDNPAKWMDKAPYKKVDPKEFGEVKWRGHCHCGRIEYHINREKPLMAKFCHCRGCQVLHGAPFQWCAVFHKEDLTFPKGAEDLVFYHSRDKTTEYKTPTKVACGYCRAPIMDEGNNVCLLFPELINVEGSYDEEKHRKEGFLPKCHIFYEQRLVDISDDLDKWSGMDGESEKLDMYGKRLNEEGEK
ncbi:hypothetical protein N7461_001270 [Penicillium sp. DV-2018c]|nr:hypothetical protein N7461_001270 [Penicillium sp. DV-2018c]